MTTPDDLRRLADKLAAAQKSLEDMRGDLLSRCGGAHEIAAMCYVSANQVKMWAARRRSNGFPEPLAVFGMGALYDLEQVRSWHADYVRHNNYYKAKRKQHDSRGQA